MVGSGLDDRAPGQHLGRRSRIPRGRPFWGRTGFDGVLEDRRAWQGWFPPSNQKPSCQQQQPLRERGPSGRLVREVLEPTTEHQAFGRDLPLPAGCNPGTQQPRGRATAGRVKNKQGALTVTKGDDTRRRVCGRPRISRVRRGFGRGFDSRRLHSIADSPSFDMHFRSWGTSAARSARASPGPAALALRLRACTGGVQPPCQELGADPEARGGSVHNLPHPAYGEARRSRHKQLGAHPIGLSFRRGVPHASAVHEMTCGLVLQE